MDILTSGVDRFVFDLLPMLISLNDERRDKQAGAELCQAQASLRYRVFQKKWCSVYFANISATKHLIFK